MPKGKGLNEQIQLQAEAAGERLRISRYSSRRSDSTLSADLQCVHLCAFPWHHSGRELVDVGPNVSWRMDG